ncbi:TPA: hypothetical protein QH074_004310 [Enterobacter hormaechei subsp. steigerwaltii]|nr:hypothetical protein [Enterobacter hormaechei subsp. steigerwaltii]
MTDNLKFKVMIRVDVVPDGAPLPTDAHAPRLTYIVNGERTGSELSLKPQTLSMQPMPLDAAGMIYDSLTHLRKTFLKTTLTKMLAKLETRH